MTRPILTEIGRFIDRKPFVSLRDAFPAVANHRLHSREHCDVEGLRWL